MPHTMMMVAERAPDPIRRALPAEIARVARQWSLSPKQRLVIAELVMGKRNKEIAEALGCAEVTVEYHLSAIRKKTGLGGRAALIARFWIDAHAQAG
jgi:DNA-binding CsgD family transcriptional regulator